ncbi:MAG: hypothetical protein OXU75_11145 [Deltaproteobacteria bacterium]|nr:hypothetical protein [Deltaproteobacteria bacterium]
MKWIPASVVMIVGLLVWKGEAAAVAEFLEDVDHILTLLIGGGIGAGAYHAGRVNGGPKT